MTGADVAALRAASPDLVLLVGGTDGGNADVLLHNAERIAKARLSAPVVVAGNADAADEVAALLASTGRRHVVTANVLPRIGVVAPEAARAAIREAFLTHVIGGKGLSRGRGFAELVRAPTPDAVLRGVEVLADVVGGDVLVVDVGGATTDVYSVITPQGEDATHPPRGRRHAVARPHRRGRPRACAGRAEGVVEAAERERLAVDRRHGTVRRGCRSATRPTSPPRTPSGRPRRRSPRRPRWWPCAGTAGPRTRRSGRARSPRSSLVVGLRRRAAARARSRRRPRAGAGHRRPRRRLAGARARAPGGWTPRTCSSPSGCSPTGYPTRPPPWPPRSRSPLSAEAVALATTCALTAARVAYGVAMSSDWPWADEFEPDGTYLNSATMGLPPRATLAALAAGAGRVAPWRRPRAGLRRRRGRRPGGVRPAGGRRRRTRWPSAARCRRWSRSSRRRCRTGRRCSCRRGSSPA